MSWHIYIKWSKISSALGILIIRLVFSEEEHMERGQDSDPETASHNNNFVQKAIFKTFLSLLNFCNNKQYVCPISPIYSFTLNNMTCLERGETVISLLITNDMIFTDQICRNEYIFSLSIFSLYCGWMVIMMSEKNTGIVH